MAAPENPLQPVSPSSVLEQLAKAVPRECRENIVVIRSLAVGYHFFRGEEGMVVRTPVVVARAVFLPEDARRLERRFCAGRHARKSW